VLRLCLTAGRELPAQASPALGSFQKQPPASPGRGHGAVACQILGALRFARKLTRLANGRKPICFLSVISTSGLGKRRGNSRLGWVGGNQDAQGAGDAQGLPIGDGAAREGAEPSLPPPRSVPRAAGPRCSHRHHQGCCTQRPSASAEPTAQPPSATRKQPRPAPTSLHRTFSTT